MWLRSRRCFHSAEYQNVRLEAALWHRSVASGVNASRPEEMGFPVSEYIPTSCLPMQSCLNAPEGLTLIGHLADALIADILTIRGPLTISHLKPRLPPNPLHQTSLAQNRRWKDDGNFAVKSPTLLQGLRARKVEQDNL